MGLSLLSRSMVEKKISPVEVIEQTLENIKNENPKYNALITVCETEALTQARIAEDQIILGEVKGLFHGIPIAVKDMIYTKGIRTTMGSKIYKDFIPKYDATIIKKLKNAGAIIIGKANTHEFAYGPTGDRSYFGPSYNPYNKNKITGGSSSGSAAAIATSMAYAALGTDTGGSIRIPSSICGVVGMKPTFGLVSKYGVFDLSYTLDHSGPMTKTVEENAFLLNVLAGYDSLDSNSIRSEESDYSSLLKESVSGKVIGIPSRYFYDIDTKVLNAIEKVIDVYIGLGAEVIEVEIGGMEEIAKAQLITLQSEAYAVHERNLKLRKSDFDPEVYERLLKSKEARGYEYVSAQQRRGYLINEYNKVFNDVDVLLTPTIPILPTDINQREVLIGGQLETVRQTLLRLTSAINYTGNPGLAVPCGFSKDGLPIGFQLIGKHGKEALLYQFGYSYENHVGIYSS